MNELPPLGRFVIKSGHAQIPDQFSRKLYRLTVFTGERHLPCLRSLTAILIREIGLTFLATVLVLLALVLSHRLAGYLSKAASGLLARDAIFVLLGLQSLYFLIVLIPLAFLLSVMLTLGRLYHDHEMMVLMACGYGPLSVYRAAFMLAAPLALLSAALSLLLVPAVMELQFEVLNKARKEAEVSLFTLASSGKC